MDHGDAIRRRARALGFDALGFARADEPLERDHARYQRFVAAGMHADMRYLAEHGEARRRLDTPAILDGARTVICCARRYARDERDDPPLSRRVARYARGRDYHGFMRKRLQQLAAFVRGLEPGTEARALVDTAPVLERAWAARAGLGFVGKNGLLIVPGQGSYCLLGEVVTTLRIEAVGTPFGERCGSCVACLDACPTGAFAAPFVLDPRRCISYATIEARPASGQVDPALWEAMGDHLFGCDVCQEVCPYNAVGPAPAGGTAPFAPLPRWSETDLGDFVRADEARWQILSQGSPLRRATRTGMARNALLVAAKRGAHAVLAAGTAHDDPGVRALAERLLSRSAARGS